MFTWFTTFTFRDSPRTYTAINRARKFIRAIEREEGLKIGYYLCMELNRLGAAHFHALMGDLTGVCRQKWWFWWFTQYGAARILPYDPKLGAAHYLTKYVTKGNYQKGWYDIQGLEYLDQLTFDKKIK